MITKEMVTRKLNFDSGSGKDSKPTTMRRVSQRNAEKPKQKTKYDLTRLSTSEFNNLIEGVDPQLEVVNKNVIAQKKLETGQKKKSEMNIHAEVNRTNNIYEDSGSSSESDTEISNHQGSLPKKSLNPSSNNANSSQPHSNEANSSHGHSKDSQFQFGASVSTELVHCSPNKSSLITTNKSSCPNLSSSSVLGSKIQLGISKKVESLSKTVFGPKVTCPPKQLNMSMNSLATASHVNPSGTGPEVSTDVGSHSPKSDTSGKENDGKDNVPSDKSIHGPTNFDEGQSKDKGSPKHDGEDFLSNDTDLNDTLATTADKSTQTHSVFVGCDCLSCAEILKTFFAHNGPITNQRGVDTDREISNLSSSTLLPHATPNNNTVNSDGEQMTPIVQGCPTVMIPLSAKGALPTEVPDRDPKKIVGYLLESMYPTVELAKMTHDGKTKNSTKLPKNVAKTLLVYTAAKYDKKKFKFNGTLFKSFVNDKFYTARRWVWKHRPELVEQGVVRGPMKKHTKKETDSTADKAKAGGNKSRKRKTERRTKSNSKEVIHADSKKKKKEKRKQNKSTELFR